MGRRRQGESLQIALNGRRVGWLTREPDGRSGRHLSQRLNGA